MCDKPQNLNMWRKKLNKWNYDKTKKKIKLWQNSKLKLKQNLKIKFWQNSKTQIVQSSKKSNCYKTQILKVVIVTVVTVAVVTVVEVKYFWEEEKTWHLDNRWYVLAAAFAILAIFFVCFFLQIGEISWWRVCYQRGQPRLVLI